MNVIIAGARDFYNYNVLLGAIQKSGFIITEVVSGGARGVDQMGERFALENNLPCKVFPAEWDTYGLAAGPIRNRKMAEYGDALIALLKSDSKGTKNMVEIARKNGLKIYVEEI